MTGIEAGRTSTVVSDCATPGSTHPKHASVEACLHTCPITVQNASPPSPHSLPVHVFASERRRDDAWDEVSINADRAELEDDGVGTHCTHGKLAVWKQSAFCPPQNESPPSSHSVPKHAPPKVEDEV